MTIKVAGALRTLYLLRDYRFTVNLDRSRRAPPADVIAAPGSAA
jgi:hypothetical protein